MMRSLIISLLLVLPLTVIGAENNWSGDIELNVGYNDNIYYQANDIEIVNNGIEQNTDVQNQFIFGSYYKFLDRKNSDMKLIVDYFHESYSENEIETSITTATLPYTYYTYSNRVRITPLLSRYVIDGDAALLTTGSSFDITHKMGRYNLGATYQYLSKSSLSSSYDKYQGAGQDLNIHYSGRWFKQYFKLSAGAYSNAYDETVDGDESHEGVYASASYVMRRKGAELALYGKVKTKDYVTDPFNGFNRSDVNSSLSITPSYAITKATSAYANVQWTKNSSNQNDESDNMNYTQTVTSIGFKYAF
ncbi:hypothetical protein ACFL2V_12450 [Pseudomonadota bacterium]